MSKRQTDPWTIMARRCLLCAQELSPHEADPKAYSGAFGLCAECGKDAVRVSRGKVHLVVEGPEEYRGSLLMKADFDESMKPATYRAVYDKGTLIRLFDTAWDQTKEAARLLEENPTYEVVEEDAFTWPEGMVVPGTVDCAVLIVGPTSVTHKGTP